MAYTSIVDYLKAQGKDSSFGARSTLAAQKGIQNYTGTAKQNIQLLGILQTPAPANPVYQPTPAEQAVQKSYPGGVVPGAGFPNVESPAQAAVKPGQFENPIMPPPMPPAESSVSVGKDYISSRISRGMPADENSIIDDWNKSGLRQKYGDWKGSNVQYNALIQLENISAQTAKIKQQADELAKQQGQNPTPSGATEISSFGTPSSGGEVNSTYKYTPLSDVDYQGVMDSVVEKIGTTDLAKLISDFSGGELTTPELELSKEDRDAKLEEIKTASTGALKKLQNGLAAKGMTFSGIRTQEEAALAADTLAKEAGVGREFAERIINAARQEQSRRETALKAAETNYNNILKEMGYVYNPFTDTIEPTLNAKKSMQKKTINVGGSLMEYDPETGELSTLYEKQNSPRIVNAGGNLFEYDPDTGAMNMVYQASKKDKNLSINFQTDSEGNVTKIVTDPTTGQTIRTEDLGKLGKSSSGNDGDEFTQTQLNKGAATAGTDLKTFQTYDYETKNYLINRGSDFSGFKSDMLETKQDPGRAAYSKNELLDAIKNSSAPEKIKNMWTEYYYTLWPQTDKGWWGGFTDLFSLIGG